MPKTTGHTPEPWVMDETRQGYYIYPDGTWGEGVHPDETSIALVYGKNTRAKANARLIAAAPDMLALLRELDNVYMPRDLEARRQALLARVEGK